MALAVSTVWETRASGASDNNGGGWAPITVSTFSGSDLVVDASLNTKVTSASHNFVAADVGARLYITNAPGTWTAGFYTINSVAANAATLSASPAAISSTGGVWSMVGVDRSQQNAAQVAIDNSTITTSIAANVITFTGYVPTVADVGNVVQMLTGTNVTAGFYQITAFTATTWTVSGAVNLPTSGTTTNATGNMGGALATLGKLAGAMVSSNKAYCTGAFTSTATTTFAQSAVFPSSGVSYTRLVGYGAARGDATHATLALSTNTGLTGIVVSNAGGWVEQFDVDCGSLGTSTGISVNLDSVILNCKAANFTTRGITTTGVSNSITACEATGGTAAATAAIDAQSAGVAGAIIWKCNVHDNTCPGIKLGVGVSVIGNLITNNSGASSDGIQITNNHYGNHIKNNTIHNNGRHGINNLGAQYIAHEWTDNLITNNGGFGILGASTALPAASLWDGNAYFSNTSGARSNLDNLTGIFGVNPYSNVRDVTLTASPYVGPTTGSTANFALNNTAGGGAACRAAGAPGTFPGNTGTTGKLDIGAVQSQAVSTPYLVMATG